MRSFAFVGVLLVMLVGGPAARAGSFLELTAVTPGTSGTFTGTLNGVAVTGAITANDGSYEFTLTGLASWDNSVLNNTSPQYSYSNIYTPSIPLTDQVGYDKFASSGTATVTITFGSPVTDPVFHVANLDASADTFSLTGGLTGLSLLSGNGGAGDGLGVSGNTVLDLNPDTGVGQDPSTPPLTSGPRSAYGSVELLGTISTLTFSVSYPGLPPGDGGSFTLSAGAAAVPEPSSLALLCVAGALSGIACSWWRRKKGMKQNSGCRPSNWTQSCSEFSAT
ncbi:MAG: PEP-CTERM sorting domain-containing protein [Isosphaeraceae bacterium]